MSCIFRINKGFAVDGDNRLPKPQSVISIDRPEAGYAIIRQSGIIAALLILVLVAACGDASAVGDMTTASVATATMEPTVVPTGSPDVIPTYDLATIPEISAPVQLHGITLPDDGDAVGRLF